MRRAAIFIAVLAIVAGLLMLLFSVVFKEKTSKKEGLSIAASFYPLAHFAQKAAGPGIEVLMITPAGAESHDFEPTPRDLKRVSEADIFIYNGAGLDPWAERIAPTLKAAGVTTIAMSSHFDLMKAPEEHGHDEHGHEEGAFDPHIWLDPVMAAKQVSIIGDALAEKDPANSSDYRANAGQYARELERLDEEYRKGLSQCGRRDIVVAHDAFSYLGKRYDLNMIAVTGIFAGEEPSARRISEITKIVRQKSIRYIFFEPLASPKIARIIARETGAEVLELNPLEGLTKEEIAAGKDYISIMRDNLTNLRKALECR